MYKILINGNEFKCYGYNWIKGNGSDEMIFVISDTDYLSVKPLIEAINRIVIKDETNAVLVDSTKFVTYDLIYFQDKSMNAYFDGNTSIDTFSITLKNSGYEDRLKKLEDVVLNEFDDSKYNLEEYKIYRKNLVMQECKNVIEKGVDVVTNNITEHFAYNEFDKELIHALYENARLAKVSQYFRTANGEYHLYAPEDIFEIYASLQKNAAYQTAYATQLCKMIDACMIKEDVRLITFGMKLPVENEQILADVDANIKASYEASMVEFKKALV